MYFEAMNCKQCGSPISDPGAIWHVAAAASPARNDSTIRRAKYIAAILTVTNPSTDRCRVWALLTSLLLISKHMQPSEGLARTV